MGSFSRIVLARLRLRRRSPYRWLRNPKTRLKRQAFGFHRQLGAFLLASLTAAPGGARQDQADEPILGAPSEIREAADGVGAVLVEAGTRLHGEPDVRSPAVAMIDVEIELAVLDRRQHWAQVRYGGWKGWVAIGTLAEDLMAADRPGQAAWRLALAREMLGLSGDAVAPPGRDQLGTFALFTDVENPRLLRFLSRIASHLPEAFRERYGLEPGRAESAPVKGGAVGAPVKRGAGGAPGSDAVVIFAREEDYRAYEAQVRPESDRGALGHAAHGIAVLYVGRQGPEDVAAVLVHELTHVLSHRALAAAPPSWLDEGMANDLAFCRIDGGRRLELGSLGGRSVVIEEHSYRPGGWLGVDQAVYLSGPTATRNQLRERWRSGGAIRIEALAELPAGQFFDPEDRQVRYDTSAFFVRYLLDGESGELAPGFRAFLAALAGSRSGEAPALPAFLGRDWAELEAGFTAWLAAQRP